MSCTKKPTRWTESFMQITNRNPVRSAASQILQLP